MTLQTQPTNRKKTRITIRLHLWAVVLWLICWFLAIWVNGYHLKLFFTGLFVLFLSNVFFNLSKKEYER